MKKDSNLVVREILEKLWGLTKNRRDFKRYLLMLEELSTSRDLKEIIKEEEMGLQDLRWEDLPSYEIGLERGIVDGLQKGIQKGMQKGLLKAVLAFKKLNYSDEKIAELLEIDKSTIETLLKNIDENRD